MIRSSLIAAVTGAALFALRIRAASARQAAWSGVMLTMLVLPAWMAWGPKASIRVLPARHAASVTQRPAATVAVAQSSRAPVNAAPPRRSGINETNLLLLVYALGAGVLLLRLAIGTLRANRLTSASVSAPVTVGLVWPRIVLPESARDWPSGQLNAMLAHEREHVRRRDPLFQWLALFNRAVFWFHPLAWWLERRLGALAEEACDTAVLERGHDAREYSLLLLTLARAVERAGTRVNVVAPAMPGVYLPERIQKIAAGRQAPRVSKTRAICTVFAVAVPSVLFAAGTLDRAIHALPPVPIRAEEIPVRSVWIAQAQTAPATSGPGAPGVKSTPEFEVASVRQNLDPNYIDSTTPSLKVGGDQYVRFVQVTLRDLIMLAYGVGSGQVQGPSFLNGSPDNPADRFDVNAKVPAGATPEQVPLMLGALLADRFHLSFHRESKAMDIYALEIAKGGLKMKESPEGSTGAAQCKRTFAQSESLSLAASCTRLTAADIAQQVQALAPGYFRDGPVVDLTGLKGTYDFSLEWITAGAARQGADGPTMFDAVEKQLGLKLERRKQPVDLLVIDKLDRNPTDN